MTAPLVLIHGAWQGSWSFDALRPELAERGLSSVAIDLPGNGVDDTPPGDVTLTLYLDFLAAVISDLGGRASLVGHSGGGLMATAMAEHSPEAVESVIYLAGMCLPSGEDFGQLQARVGGSVGISHDIVVADDGLTSTVPHDKAIEYFLQDVDLEVARSIVAKLTPQPEGGRLITTPATEANFGSVPKLYIEAELDASISVEAQRAMQALAPDMSVVSLATGHVPQLVAPAAVAEAISEFLQGLGDGAR